MKKNMSNTDRIVRLIVAAIIAVFYFSGAFSGVLGLILLVLAVVFVITSFVSYCPLYTVFGMSTRKEEEKK